MTSRTPRRARRATAALGLLTLGLLPGLVQLPAFAAEPAPGPAPSLVTLGDPVAGPSDVDRRGTVLPTAAQRRAAGTLGAVDLRWNDFGTPSSILPADGSLGRASSDDAAKAARAWLSDHAPVFGLRRAQVADLEVVNAQRFAQSNARAVLFRQRFGTLSPALGSMVTVGVADGEIAYVSSSLTRSAGVVPAAVLSGLQGWLEAAADVGRGVPAADVAAIEATEAGGWTRLTVPGFAQEQQVRLRALAMADGRVRPVLEANVVDVRGGAALAYTSMVDAVTGEVLHRQNQVENSSDVHQFNGTVTATECGPRHPFELTDGKTRTIVAVANSVVPTDDIVIKILDADGEVLTSGDTGTSPEAVAYTASSIPAGRYAIQVCPYDSPSVPITVGPYAAFVATSDEGLPGAGEATTWPRWRYFTANPSLKFGAGHTPTNTVVGCWVRGKGCTLGTGPLRNVQAMGPWDSLVTGGFPTLTTIGNNANTHEAWFSPLTPGGLYQAPVSPTRSYTGEFTDAWNNDRCSQSTLTPGGNDIDFVTGNLFVSHNRMHDYAYYLGFNERNYNLQLDNAGRGGVPGDQEIGNAQAGAVTGGAPSYLGRDNANQITLQDGIPGITNQYLFQPIAGAFYSPCVDGSLDMSIVGHEYTHAITNRMVGGPDEGLTSEQGGAMGESWGDLVGAEYLVSHGYSTGANPWAVGPYATGNRRAGIRDYPINKNPLNYGDYGFDSTGDEVHADGEIWNGTMWETRQALVRKWDRRFPSQRRELNLKCAQGGRNKGVVRPQKCPGNRRWVQLMFDSFLLQQGATSMLDARDAFLAADRMRFRGENQNILWAAFARRGFGKGASTPNADSGDTKPSFASARGGNVQVRFSAPSGGRVYVGHYEARSTPIADTIASTGLGSSAQFTPGRYEMLYVSPKRGFKRFSMIVKPGQGTRVVRIGARTNLAAAAAGAKVLASTAGSLNPEALIDGTEATNWGGVTSANVDESKPSVAVDLAGGVRTVRRVQVSAMLTPAAADAADQDSGSRFTALRRFALEACVSSCGSPSATWKRFFTSAADAFPAIRPRPVAPDLTLRSFKVTQTRAAAVRLVVLENQCTGTPGYAGEQDDDELNATDCATASDRGTIVHASELQVFDR